jgi:hypothetical protein
MRPPNGTPESRRGQECAEGAAPDDSSWPVRESRRRVPWRNLERLSRPDKSAEFLLPKGIVARWRHHRSDAGFRSIDRSAHPVVATACCHCMIFFIICARSPKGSARNRLHRLQDVEDHVGTRVLRCSRFVPWTRPHSLHDQTAQPSRRGSCQVEGDSRLRKFVSSATQAASLAAQRNALKLRRRSAPTAG